MSDAYIFEKSPLSRHVKAVILAAGRGTRLRPLTDNWPKHLLEIAGIPILKRILDDLLSADQITQCRVVLNYQADRLESALAEWYDDPRIQMVYQQRIQGTGDAVREALSGLTVQEPFVVVNGDVIMGTSLASVLSEFEENDDGLVVGTKVPDPSQFGVFSVDDQGYLTGLLEKPPNAAPDSLINAGFYVFPAIAAPQFSSLDTSERGELELTDVLVDLVQSKQKIRVIETTEWYDIGRPWHILEANQSFMDREQQNYDILGEVETGAHLHGNVHVAATARIRSGVYIEGPAYIDEGADIGPNCYIRGRTYLGRNTRVGNACEIKNSVIYEDTHVAHLSYVGDSVIGHSCNLGAGTITANLRHDNRNIRMTVKKNRIDTGRRKIGVIMGSDVKTGIGVNLLPGVKISSGTWVNAGETVIRDR